MEVGMEGEGRGGEIKCNRHTDEDEPKIQLAGIL